MTVFIAACFAAMLFIILLLIFKIVFLYRGMKEISEEFDERLREDTNNVIYVSGNDRRLRAFAAQINRELGILYDRRRKYQSGDRELKEAVVNISHDLRTPVTAINGYLELLETEPKSESVANYLVQLGDRTEALKSLTEELFRYSIIVSEQDRGIKGNHGSQREKVILNRALADCLLSYYDIFGCNGIDPDVIIPDEEIVRFLDSRALKRIFCNILDNAVKYSEAAEDGNGTVSESNAGKSARKKLWVELSPDGTITFCNRAGHLDKVSIERLFDRFYTVETGRNSTGLGLSIARILMERMRGEISAEYQNKELIIRLKF